MPSGGPTEGGGDDRGKAIAKAVAKSKERQKDRPREIEEERVEIKAGEKVLEDMSTLDALSCLGVCPANFEWFELNISDPPNENCGICGYKLSDGYRCGGGTHFVCMSCIDHYKTTYTR